MIQFAARNRVISIDSGVRTAGTALYGVERPEDMSPEPDVLRQFRPLSHACGLPSMSICSVVGWSMPKTTSSFTLPVRVQALAAELRDRAPEWADRLSSAQSQRELMEAVGALFNLAHALKPPPAEAQSDEVLPGRIDAFMKTNLHKGVTLKLLAQHLGYSEKYSSDLFLAIMGESFSKALKRRRIHLASRLLKTTERAVADIARVVGFSDQFAFSHFFKRATGQSPIQFRSHHHRRSRKPSSLLSKGRS